MKFFKKRSGFVAVFILLAIILLAISSVKIYQLVKINNLKKRVESPKDFNAFLDSCTVEERKQLMLALRDDGEPTPEGIRKALVWRAYNKMTYMFRGDKEVEYHELVQWAASKQGVDKQVIES